MRKYILALLVAILVLVVSLHEIRGSTTNFDRFYKYNVIEEVIDTRFREREILTLALNIYHEARGSTYEDKVAVAEVTMNRVRSPKYPNTVYDVVYQYKQFSWTLFNKRTEPKEYLAWVECQKIALAVYDRKKPIIVDENVLHYVHNKIVDKIIWARSFKNRKRIGAHVYLS